MRKRGGREGEKERERKRENLHNALCSFIASMVRVDVIELYL